MELTVLSANIAFGLREMDKPWRNFFAHLGIHGWRLIPLLIAGRTTTTFFDLSKGRYPERTEFFKDYSDLSAIVAVIEEEKPDIVVLNELLYRIHKHELETWLREDGFTHFAWGRSAHHKSYYGKRDMTMATVVASKLPIDRTFIPDIPQKAQPGGGGGISGIRLADEPVTIIGLHLSIYDKGLWKKQIKKLSRIVQEEKALGRKVILAGDWNATSQQIFSYPEFKGLKMRTLDAAKRPTCPTFSRANFPAVKQIDHIIAAEETYVKDFSLGDFGSDHRWISATMKI